MTYTLIYFEYGSSECIFLSLRREIWFEDIQQKTKYVTVYFVIQVEFQWKDVKFLF